MSFSPFRFSLVSLGCPKNLVDSETMVGRLVAAGFEFLPTFDPDDRGAPQPDFVILNTCGFLGAARAEAREHLAELLALKKRGRIKSIFVTGCMVRFEGEADGGAALATAYPQVDGWLGVADEAGIVEAARTFFPDIPKPLEQSQMRRHGSAKIAPQRLIRLEPSRQLHLDDGLRRPLTAPHVAYLKIADGCNRLCSFCAIPSIRGRFVSKPLETVVAEARRLAANGVKELILIAQETTFYGSDLDDGHSGGRTTLAELLKRLDEIDGIRWIRLLYTYPQFFGEEMLERFTTPGTKLLPYVDMPLQHASDPILKAMRRGVHRARMEELLEQLRARIPGLVLRTSLIVGFPGETDAMFEELVAFVKRWRFERAGIFPFSAEPGTHAATLPDRVPQAVIDRRFRKLLNIQDRIARKYAQSQVGCTVEVLIDAPLEGTNGELLDDFHVGRTYADAPDIDPVVYVTGDAHPGDIVRCEVFSTSETGLAAVVTEI